MDSKIARNYIAAAGVALQLTGCAGTATGADWSPRTWPILNPGTWDGPEPTLSLPDRSRSEIKQLIESCPDAPRNDAHERYMKMKIALRSEREIAEAIDGAIALNLILAKELVGGAIGGSKEGAAVTGVSSAAGVATGQAALNGLVEFEVFLRKKGFATESERAYVADECAKWLQANRPNR